MRENRRRYVLVCQQMLALGTVAALAVSGAGVVSLEIVAPAPSQPGSAGSVGSAALVAAEPVEPEVVEVPLSDRLSAPQDVDGVATVGVTWAPGVEVDEDAITVSVRSYDDGTWGPWERLEYHDDHAPDPGSVEARNVRPGTEPIVVGTVEEVQVKVETDDGEVPEGARLAVIDPGVPGEVTRQQPAIDTADLSGPGTMTLSSGTTTPDDATTPTSDPTGDPAAGEPDPVVPMPEPVAQVAGSVAVTPRPMIFSRAQWGADESMRTASSLRYGEVHAGFVHHTVNANDYTKEQVPALLRGIYAYHTRSKGWSDIGYNFVVDRFGRIWEGRYGGVERPVVGAHTLGFNEYSFAMSALGNFDITKPSVPMLDAYGRLFAWKLSLHGVSAASTRQLVGSRYFPAVNGHRDAGSTACPGRYLYAQLGQIRSLSAAYQVPFTSRTRSTNLAGSPWPDLVVRHRESRQAFVLRTGGQTGFATTQTAATGWQGTDLFAPSRDLTGDGVPDVVARTRADGRTRVYAGTPAGTVGGPVSSTRRFRWADQLAAVGNLGAGGAGDVVARMAESKTLYLFPGNGTGGFLRRRVLAADWGSFDLTAAAGDLDRNGRPELLARSAGRLYRVPMDGRQLGTPVRIPGAWGRFAVITGGGDLTNDGVPDVVAQERKSRLVYLYPGTGQGRLAAPLGPFRQFKTLTGLGVAGQLAPGGGVDLVGRDRSGALYLYPNNGYRNVEAFASTGTELRATNLVVNVGDWNGDGFGDIMTRAPRSGYLWLRRGTGSGSFAAPVLAAKGWKSVRLVDGVGDITGDGLPDLIGQPAGGPMRIYPGNGATGLRRSYVARSAIDANAQTGLGLWDTDGSPDSLARRSDGTLQLYRGNGPGGLLSPRRVGSGMARYDWLRAVGDADGDGRPDLVVREKRTGVLWLLPGTETGFGARRFLAAGFSGYDLAG